MSKSVIKDVGMNQLLNRAIIIATEAHSGQLDKADKPYILHPLYVMTKVLSVRLKIIAVLHDILEDTKITEEDLIREGFPSDVITPLKLLTKGKEKYRDYILRLSKDWGARRVKLADLDHNLDLNRLTYPFEDRDLKRIKKYYEARQDLDWIDMGGKLE